MAVALATFRCLRQKLHAHSGRGLQNKTGCVLKSAPDTGNWHLWLFVKIDNKYYDVTLIPMMGMDKEIEGYLVGYPKYKFTNYDET